MHRIFKKAEILYLAISGLLLLSAHGFSTHSFSRRSLSMSLAPHAAPTDSASSLREMTNRALEGLNRKKILSLLGSTGSIGTQTLDIVRERPNQFECVAMAAGSNLELFLKQIVEFKPKIVSVQKESSANELRNKLRGTSLPENQWPTITHGNEGIVAVATYPDADTVVTGIVGCAGLLPTVAAIKAGKDIALANKETLIAGGPIVVPLLAKHNVKMLPADSEHSAIFQCLQGVPPGALKKIILTASGGAFRYYTQTSFTKKEI